MRSPWQIRLQESINSLARWARSQSKPILAKDLIDLERAIFASPDLQPSTDDLKLIPFEPLETERFLAYNRAIEADSNTITKSLDEFEQVLRNFWILIDIENISTKATERIAKLYLALLSASTFIDGVTREVAIPDELEIPPSSISVAGNVLSMRAEAVRFTQHGTYVEDDVEVIVTKQQTMTANALKGRKSSILDRTFERGFSLTVVTRRVDDVEVTARIRARAPVSNKVTLELTPSVVGTILTVYVVSARGVKPVNIFSSVVNNEVIEIYMADTAVEQLIVVMEKNFPDIKTEKQISYVFAIEKVRIENTNTARFGQILSKPIKVEDGSIAVALLAEDYIPSDSSVQYEIAPVADEDEIPEQFFTVKPNNQNPASVLNNNELPEERFVSLLRNKAQVNLIQDEIWNLPVVLGYRRRLFNLLSPFVDTEINKDLKIGELEGQAIIGLVDEASGIEVIDDSIVVYNGIKDWTYSKGEFRDEDTVDGIVLDCIFDPASAWFTPIEILEPYTQSYVPRDKDTIQASLDFPVEKRDNFRLFDESGVEISAYINSGMGTKDISLNYVLEKNKVYTFTYLIKVRSTTNIDRNTLKVFSGTTQLTFGNDYSYSDINRTIILNRASPNILRDSNAQRNVTIVVSYKRTVIDDRLSKRVIFETWLYLDRTTTVPINPFTPVEVAAGNFHSINGQDVSLVGSVELNPGEHHIFSTQPEPSAVQFSTDTDFNSLTKRKSSAGINLEGLNYRAYRFPMRRVNIADLELNVEANDPKVYSFVNGSILLARQPDFVEQGFLDTPNNIGMLGSRLRAKIINQNTGRYLTKPEQFLVQMSYKVKTAKGYVRIRITMNRGGAIGPRVSRLGIVPIAG